MRVLHLYAGNLFGGIETCLVTLARLRHLAPEMEPEFGLCFHGRLWDELVETGVVVHDLGLVRVRRPTTVWRARRSLAELLRGRGYSAVVCHAWWPHAVFAPAVRQQSICLITYAHDAMTGSGWVERWATRTNPDLVIANSRFTASSVNRTFARVPTAVVYLPVPRPEATGHDGVRQTVRAGLGTPEDAVVILQASRLERWKGQAVHLEALGRLRSLPGWEAWFAGGPQKGGEGEYFSSLERMAYDLGIADRVRFLGQRSDVPQLMAAADIYCQPNTAPEPFGIVYVEALHAALPVIASAFGGAAEIVTAGCGVLTPPSDSAAVAQALAELISRPIRRADLAAAAPARAMEVCDPALRIPQLAHVISGLKVTAAVST